MEDVKEFIIELLHFSRLNGGCDPVGEEIIEAIDFIKNLKEEDK